MRNLFSIVLAITSLFLFANIYTVHKATINQFFGAPSNRPSAEVMEWLSLSLKQHEISQEEMDEFARSIYGDYSEDHSVSKFRYFKNIVSDIFLDVLTGRSPEIGVEYQNDNIQLDNRQVMSIYNEVMKSVNDTYLMILDIELVDFEVNEQGSLYNTYTFIYVSNGEVYNIALKAYRSGRVYYNVYR